MRSPTSLDNPSYTSQTSLRRTRETYSKACQIHGATKTNKRPALDGLFDTLQKRCKTSELGDYILCNTKVTNYVIDKKQKEEREAFQNSRDNMLRSVATYYTAGVMGKRKYQAVRLASTMKSSAKKRGGKTAITFMSKCPIPKLLTYNSLIKEVNKIDIGTIYSIKDQFAPYVEDENTSGCFRDLREFLPRLASFYLKVQNSRKDALKWFAETEGTFLIAFGGDGCPFGKNGTACSFLLSFLNTGKRVASSSDNFLIFGANCEESSLVVKKYVLAVCKQMADLEGKVFNINDLPVTFKFQELPNDMKMLAMLGGELSNAATYFSSFANVSRNDYNDLQATFGTDPLCKWRPWSFQQRVKVAESVEKFKNSLQGKPGSAKAKRSKVTDFIARQKSRQEIIPLVGKLIDKAHVEPLHLKNNAWQYFFKALLKEAIGKSDILPTHKTFSDVPEDSCFANVVTALRYEVKTTRLATKVKKWFDETQGKQGDLQYRFTGKESRLFCHNFMRLIKVLSREGDCKKQRQTVLTLVYIGIRLRDCCSIFNRFEVQETDLSKLKSLAEEYYRANAMFLPSAVNPTVWTIGHVLPVHAMQVYNIYKQGLLTVTMEEREAKHIALQRLSVNTTYQQRWQEIFRHEFVMLIWLPEQGYEPCSYAPSKSVYISPRVFNDSSYCYCGLQKADPTDTSCYFCSDNIFSLIHKSVKQGKILPGIDM